MFWVRETLLDRTGNYIFSDGDWWQTGDNTLGTIFKAFQREYGRCTGKMYIDRPKRFDGPSTPLQIGWIFESKQRFEDARSYRPEDYYIREAWVEVSTTEPEKVVQVNNITSPWLGRKER
jgi:hypothetical protein